LPWSSINVDIFHRHLERKFYRTFGTYLRKITFHLYYEDVDFDDFDFFKVLKWIPNLRHLEMTCRSILRQDAFNQAMLWSLPQLKQLTVNRNSFAGGPNQVLPFLEFLMLKCKVQLDYIHLGLINTETESEEEGTVAVRKMFSLISSIPTILLELSDRVFKAPPPGMKVQWLQLDLSANELKSGTEHYESLESTLSGLSPHLKTLKLIVPHMEFRPMPFNIPVLHSLKFLHIQFYDDEIHENVNRKAVKILLSLFQGDTFPMLEEVKFEEIKYKDDEYYEKTRMPDSRIGRIHHPILEADILVFLFARCARSHRCRRRKARRRLKREPLSEKRRER